MAVVFGDTNSNDLQLVSNAAINSTYNFGQDSDTVFGRGGSDTIETGHSNDYLYGESGGDALYAGYGNDELFGGSEGDLLLGGDGNDRSFGGIGDDFHFADAGNDLEDGGDGSDTIVLYYVHYNFAPISTADSNYSGVTLDLAKTTAQNLGVFGVDTIVNIENAHGSRGSDRIYGSNGANVIIAGISPADIDTDLVDGRGGNDLLEGYGGNDTLIGGTGNDQLRGWTGADVLNGGAGTDTMYANAGGGNDAARDRFYYAALSDSSASATRDQIFDFFKSTGATGDRIDLSAIDADLTRAGNQAFTFIGVAAFSAARQGEVKVQNFGATTVVYVDIDRDAAAEMSIFVSGVNNMNRADFIL